MCVCEGGGRCVSGCLGRTIERAFDSVEEPSPVPTGTSTRGIWEVLKLYWIRVVRVEGIFGSLALVDCGQ